MVYEDKTRLQDSHSRKWCDALGATLPLLSVNQITYNADDGLIDYGGRQYGYNAAGQQTSFAINASTNWIFGIPVHPSITGAAVGGLTSVLNDTLMGWDECTGGDILSNAVVNVGLGGGLGAFGPYLGRAFLGRDAARSLSRKASSQEAAEVVDWATGVAVSIWTNNFNAWR